MSLFYNLFLILVYNIKDNLIRFVIQFNSILCLKTRMNLRGQSEQTSSNKIIM